MSKAVNKVVYGNQTIVDMTDATATENDILPGKSAYLANGQRATGSADVISKGDLFASISQLMLGTTLACETLDTQSQTSHFTATRAYAVNDMFILYDGRNSPLYLLGRALVTIASGDTVVENTGYAVTSIAEAIRDMIYPHQPAVAGDVSISVDE